MKGQLRIEQMYAFIATDTDNTEGIIGLTDPVTGAQTPMVGADMKRVDSLRPMAAAIAREFGVKVTLCRFEVRTELEEIT
jgi:hypothetical protein